MSIHVSDISVTDGSGSIRFVVPAEYVLLNFETQNVLEVGLSTRKPENPQLGF